MAFLSAWILIAGSTEAASVRFTGASVGDNVLSTTGNWDHAPASGDALHGFSGTSEQNPARVDPAFSVDFGNLYVGSGSPGTAYLEVQSGAVLKAVNLYVGHNLQPTQQGQIIIRSGGALSGQFGTAMVGIKAKGTLEVEPGSELSWPGLELGTAGTLLYRFGVDSVSTFKVATKKAGQGTVLNGLVQVDLSALAAAGEYTLIDGAVPEIAGALRTWLDGHGGAFSADGDFAHSNFSVVNGSGWHWTLQLVDQQRDLSLTLLRSGTAPTVANPPQPVVGIPPVAAASAVKVLKNEGWSLEPWRAFPFDYQELSVREAPLWMPGADDLVRAGDSWVGGEKPKEGQPVTAKTDGTLRITDFYVSGGGNENGPNRIFCASAVPKEGKGPFPVLFVFHGGGGHASGALALATARKNPGFAAVAVDYNGQFSPSASPVTQWVTVTKEFRESRTLDLVPDPLNFTMYHNVQAARRVMDWTQEQPWADKGKFGVVGISYGGWVSLILAGVDDRVKCVVTHVSAGGTEGLQSRAGRPQFYEPAEQRPIWLAHGDPIAYAPATRAPVLMELSTNDRFFWLSGAARNQQALGAKAAWLLTPNSDHGSGGPELANPGGLWAEYALMGGLPFPEFNDGAFSKDGKTVGIRVGSQRPIKTVYAAWSAGHPVSPARYWRWIEAKEINGVWTAALPIGHEALAGTAYFTATDIDSRAVSSALIERSGQTKCMIWAAGSLWDTEAGSAAWRPAADLAGEVRFADQGNGRVLMTPKSPGKPSAAISNSLNIPAADGGAHRGIKIMLGGNGQVVPARVVLARDYAAIDGQLFAAPVQIPAEPAVIELPWESFKPYRAGTTEKNPLPANGLIIQSDVFPPTGISVGLADWLD